MSDASTILVVDDRPENLFVLQTQLRGLGATVVDAQSGPEALEVVRSRPVAVAIVDVVMPGMDGFQVAEALRTSEPAGSVPVVLVTSGSCDRTSLAQGYQAGAVDFLFRPIDMEVLRSKIAAFLEIDRHKRALAARLRQLDHLRADVGGEPAQTQQVFPRQAARADVTPAQGVFSVDPRSAEEAKLQRGQALGEALNRIADLLHGSLEIDEVLRRLIHEAASVLGADTAAFSTRISGGWRVACTNGMPEGLAGKVMTDDQERHAVLAMQMQQPLAVSDVCTDGRVNRTHLLAYAVRAVLTVPVAHAEHVYGVIFFNYLGLPRVFDEAELHFAHQLGRTAAIALHNARLFADRARVEAALRASEARFRLLATTANKLLVADDAHRVVDELCRDVIAHLGCDVFLNYVVEGDELHLNAFGGIPEEAVASFRRLPVGAAVCGRVAQEGVRAIVNDVQSSDDPAAALLRSCGVENYCCHPLLGTASEVLGTLAFGTRKPVPFAEEDIELMRVVADQVATALERLRAQHALKLSNAQLREVDRKKNSFIATLSHELRNPLGPIRNALYVLDRAKPGDEQDRRARAVIGRQAEQMTRLVNDLLDVTRITNKKILLERRVLDLNGLIAHTAEDHRGEIERARLELTIRAAAMPVWVDADPHRIAQIVGNLLQNATKFTALHGRIAVSVAADADGYASIRIADNGIGMDSETLANLFHPFVQAPASLDRSKGGLGLGLALVKGLAELHGGSVTAESEGLGQGSTFTVRLPLTAPPTGEPPRPASEGPVEPQRILVVEDNADAAESLRDLLELDRHDVLLAPDGPTAIRRAREFRPTVILCDIGLPGMDGYAVARALRRDPALDAVELVALTGYVQADDLERAKQAGFDRHLGKPLGREELRELIRDVSSGSPRAERTAPPR